MKKRINIYIDLKDKKKLDEIKYKYHLSYSTIINIITDKYSLIILKELEQCYIYGKENTRKTSIKPKNEKKFNKESLVYTNATRIFTHGDIGKYIEDKKKIEKLNNFIYNEFENTWEENWDGNKLNRMIPRIIKANPKYYRKLIEE